jgi:iron complex outermembrane receptor protein
LYGIRGHEEESKIDLLQTRFDVDSLIRSPFEGFDALRIKLGQSDYRHTELHDGIEPHAKFTNRSLESRIELSHQPVAGWRGRLGMQTDGSTVQALNLEDPSESTVPRTRSNSTAAFIVEETDIGDVRLNAGARIEQVGRRPTGNTNRNFSLGSASFGALWSFTPGYALGSTLSYAQRAPTAEELYSGGAHHPTETFDIGSSSLKKETSQNIDLSLQKTEDRLRWKGNLFQNKINNFVYGSLGAARCEDNSGPTCTDPELEELPTRTFSQANATLRGYEIDVSYNLYDYGWFGRAFADDSRGTLDNLGNMPLQPVARLGTTVGYQDANWRSTLSIVNASAQSRLASTEANKAPGYTRVDANISWRQRIGENELTWFASARNLLNEEIRLSTSLLKDYVPQPGRNFLIGVRARF